MDECSLTVGDVKYDLIGNGNYHDLLRKGNMRRQIPLKEKAYNTFVFFDM
ncbi:hypothetical protein [Paenisporosarcina indica]|nr:hypothetical protein [Paenisporosarcina indica]